MTMNDQPVSGSDWKVQKMPKSHATIPVSRAFSASEMEKIRIGFRPEDMDDRWFIFYENDCLHIFRSWSGYCIYALRFEKDGENHVACELKANRNAKQYRGSDDSYDSQMAFWVIDFILLGRMDSQMPRPLEMG
jgi:hypothetical protein